MKKLVALMMALLMTVQCAAFVSAEEVYEAASVESAETETAADDMVVLEEEGVLLEEEAETPDADAQQKALYGAINLPLDNKDVTGKLSAAVPALAYVVTVPTTGVLTLVINPVYQMKVSVLNEAMTTYYVNNETIPAGAKTYNKHLNPGIYTIVLNWISSEPETAYTMKASHVSVGATISGSTILTPYTLTFGSDYVSGAITETASENWIQFNTAVAGKVTIETKSYGPGFKVSLRKTGTPFTELASMTLAAGTPNAPGNNLFSYYLEPGAYFLNVTNGTAHGVFDIRATFTGVNAMDVEPNDGVGVAQVLPLEQNMRGVLSVTDTTDVYSVMVTKATDVIVQISDYTEGVEVSMTSWITPGGNMVPGLTSPTGGTETSPVVREQAVRLEPNVMYYITVKNPTRPGYYDLVLRKKFTVETVSVSPDGGPLGITLTLSGTTSAAGTIFAFEPLFSSDGGASWTALPKIFAPKSLAQFKPAAKGHYAFRHSVFDGFQWSSAVSKVIEISDPTVVTSVTFPTTPVNHGTTVPVTINTANAKPQSYALRVIDRVTNAVVGNTIYSSTNVINYIPANPGRFVFQGLAYDGFNWSAGFSFELEVVSNLKLLSLTANKTIATTAESIRYTLTTNGEPMTMVCYIYSMGSTEIYRQFKGGSGMYTNDYTCPFPGELDVMVHAYDGAKWHGISGPKVTINSNVPTVSALDRKPSVTYVGQPITFTINGSGIPDKTVYTLYKAVSPGVVKVIITSSVRSNTFATTVAEPGSYLCVLDYTINGITNTVTNGWFDVSSETTLTNLIISPNPVKVGTKVSYNALYTGVAPKALEVYTYNFAGFTLVNKQKVYGVTAEYTPTAPGNYYVIIFVDNGSGMDYTKPFAFWSGFTAIP